MYNHWFKGNRTLKIPRWGQVSLTEGLEPSATRSAAPGEAPVTAVVEYARTYHRYLRIDSLSDILLPSPQGAMPTTWCWPSARQCRRTAAGAVHFLILIRQMSPHGARKQYKQAAPYATENFYEFFIWTDMTCLVKLLRGHWWKFHGAVLLDLSHGSAVACADTVRAYMLPYPRDPHSSPSAVSKLLNRST